MHYRSILNFELICLFSKKRICSLFSNRGFLVSIQVEKAFMLEELLDCFVIPCLVFVCLLHHQFSFLYWTFSSIYTSCHNFSQRRKNPLNPTFLSSYHPISLPICREKKLLKRVAYAHFLQFLTSGMITFSPFILFGTHSYQLFPSTGIASVKLTCDLHFVKPSDQPTSLFSMTRQKHLTQLIISFSLNHNQDITFS